MGLPYLILSWGEGDRGKVILIWFGLFFDSEPDTGYLTLVYLRPKVRWDAERAQKALSAFGDHQSVCFVAVCLSLEGSDGLY